MTSEKTPAKLYLPKLCVVPLAAREDKTLSDAAKIYLGELNVLSNKFGYLTYSDEQLAEMKGRSIRTIESWNTQLDKRGFIRRDTCREHYKNPKGNGVLIRTKRKLYVIETPSNKNTEPQNPEPQKTAEQSEPQKTAEQSEPQKTAGLIKEEFLKEESNKKEAGVPPEPPPRSQKVSFGSDGHVKMTSREYEKLRDLWGEVKLNELIEALNDYIGSTGKRYKSHYSTLKTFERRDRKDIKGTKTGTRNVDRTPRNKDGTPHESVNQYANLF